MPRVIREIRGEDAAAVAVLSRAARVEAIPNFPDLHTPEEDLAFYRAEIARSCGYVETEPGGAIGGFIIWREDFVHHLYVNLRHQRVGIGSMLLGKAIESMNCATVKLWTFQCNIKATSFYKKFGFVISKATDGDNDEKLPDYLLTFERWN